MKIIWLLLLLVSCTHQSTEQLTCSENPLLIIAVDAKHLDYSSTESFMMSMTLNDGFVGHAWITLRYQGLTITGSHSGEQGVDEPRYCDAIQCNLEKGLENPIKCLWEPRSDGFFQKGSGGHTPTYSAAIPIDDITAAKILKFIRTYNFSEYSLTGNQCTSFCTQAAAIAGLKLDDKATLPLAQYVRLKRKTYRLWIDPTYSSITFSSPDALEASLKEAVRLGNATPL